MPGREEVPAQAVALAEEAIDSCGGDAVLAAAALEAAAPTIRNQERQRIQEGLRGKAEELRDMTDATGPADIAYRNGRADGLELAADLAALDTLDPSREQGQLLRRSEEAEARAPRCSCGGLPDHPKQHGDCHVVDASSEEVQSDGE